MIKYLNTQRGSVVILLTVQNETYHTALWTGQFMQLTVMNILIGEDIGIEIHDDHDQFIRVEQGESIVRIGDAEDKKGTVHATIEEALADEHEP